MKSILSPFDNDEFNEFLLKYCKAQMRIKSKKYECEYNLDGKKYTAKDVINSLMRNGRVIYFNNRKLINYVVYDLSQRFWYIVFRDTNNIIRKLYMEFNGDNFNYDKFIIK